jgi:cell wall integrity and stress response component
VGAIVGGVVGGVGGAILLGVLAFFFIRHRNSHEESEDEEEFYDKPSGLSSVGGTSRSRSKKTLSPLDMPMSNPFTDPTDTAAAGGGNNAGLVDPRLNPIMMGRRRLSDGSLADETDYSRKVLQVANPDD